MALRVFVDFQNTDTQGRVRLNTAGSIKDLSRSELRVGIPLDLYDAEMQLAGVAAYSPEEKIWVAAVDWAEFRPATQ